MITGRWRSPRELEADGALLARIELVQRVMELRARGAVFPWVWIDADVVRVRSGLLGDPECISWDELRLMVEAAERDCPVRKEAGREAGGDRRLRGEVG